MSEILGEFYVAYLLWLNQGAKRTHVQFQREHGLCNALQNFAGSQNAYSHKLAKEMTKQFEDAGLNYLRPFDDPDNGVYFGRECSNHEMHINPKRIAWVKTHADKYLQEKQS